MNKKLLEMYALSVCFVSMGCLSIFSGIFLYGLVELSFPSTMNSSRIHYPPPFISHGSVTVPLVPGQPLPNPFSGERLEYNSDERNKIFQAEQKRNIELAAERMKVESIMSIVRSFIIMFISSIVFVFHWRIAKNSRGE